MKRILLDTNIVLDILLARVPFDAEAARIWRASDAGVFDGYIASFTIPTIHYVCERNHGLDAANKAVD